MKILFVTSECAPFSKSGGLADVAFSLPPALKKIGNEIQIITPYYKCADDRFFDKIHFVKKRTRSYILLVFDTFARICHSDNICPLRIGR